MTSTHAPGSVRTPAGERGGHGGGRRHGGGSGTAGAGLTLAALGVVFGDIGTSPLYALQTVFSIDHGAVQPTRGDVLGVLSLIFWSLIVIVTVKYVLVIMRADNDGEGGVMALSALVRGAVSGGRAATAAVLLGILGASLFYGDSLITPAISVLSAVEGIDVATPSLSSFVVPIAVTILVVLFAGQRYGTARVGALFGPVMLIWFLTLAATGVREVFTDLGVVAALSPTYGLSFVASHPGTAFIALGAIVLCITGAEALYADMGHFGRPPIRRAWFAIVFPALVLNYLGQGALLLRKPDAVGSPFFLLVPSMLRVPLVVLATAATVIASQAVISGAFSVTRQAISLGLLPPMRVQQTSKEERGQVFLPAVNWLLFAGVLGLVLAFGSSARLATAYGVSVTGALLIDTLLLVAAAHRLWHWSPARLALAAVAFGGLEALFLSANLTKVAHGGWLPLLIATLVFTLMTTWRRGREYVLRERTEDEGPLQHFVDELHRNPLPRVPGIAVFLHPTRETTPLALRANVEHNHVLHERVLIVSVQGADVPHVRLGEQVSLDDLGHTDDGIVHVLLRFGFSDTPDVPAALARACDDRVLPPSWDMAGASYFVSDATLRIGRQPSMRRWRKGLFVAMAHNATDPAERFRLPSGATVSMGTQIEL